MRGVATAAALTLIAAVAAAQDRAVTPDRAFEVASIKPNTGVDVPESISLQPNGSVRFTAFPVRTLITIAYRSEGRQRFDQLIGGPSWIAVDRFDIVAKAPEEPGAQPGPSAVPGMLRALLRDRFRLRTHTETRPMPAYALVAARRDGKRGSRLRETTIACSADDPERWCGIRATGGVITGRGVSAAELAGNLSGYPEVDLHVTDRTGLTGRYDFRLEYAPDTPSRRDGALNAGPSLFTALNEQLGLSLQPETAVLPVLIIDSIERPTPD